MEKEHNIESWFHLTPEEALDRTRFQIAKEIREWCDEVKGDGDKYFNLVGAITFLEGDGAEIKKLKEEVKKLEEENKNLREDWAESQSRWEKAYDILDGEKHDLELVLLGVMHSVDKWLEGDELKQDEVNRAATMREKTLKIIEKIAQDSEKLQKQLDDRCDRCIETDKARTVREMTELLIRRLPIISPGVFRGIANEILEGTK